MAWNGGIQEEESRLKRVMEEISFTEYEYKITCFN